MNDKLTREQMDAMREIVTIGAGNAATAFSQMIKKKVTIEVPRTNLAPISKAPEIFGGVEKFVIAVFLQVLGDAQGVILFSFEKDNANRLIDLVMGQEPGKTKVLNEISQSALKETTTILSGAYLNAISRVLKLRLLMSAPALAQDMAGAIIDNILIETSKEAEHAMVIDTELYIVDEKIMAYFFFIPDAASLAKILKLIGLNT